MCSVDSDGRVMRINYNNATRDSVLDMPVHQVQPFYSSLKAFVELLSRPENVFTYQMEPGQCGQKLPHSSPLYLIRLQLL